MPLTIPNLVTWSRIGLIPVFAALYYLPFTWNHIAAAMIFALAALTDWLDGFLARSLNQTSPFGEFLDPVADKLIVVVALVILVAHLSWLTVAAIVIIGREIAISALREWMAEIGKRAHIGVSWLGKLKTLLQMIAITVLLAASQPRARLATHDFYLVVGYILLYCAVFITLWSMLQYLRAAWPSLKVTSRTD